MAQYFEGIDANCQQMSENKAFDRLEAGQEADIGIEGVPAAKSA
jgi:hypothetical protein